MARQLSAIKARAAWRRARAGNVSGERHGKHLGAERAELLRHHEQSLPASSPLPRTTTPRRRQRRAPAVWLSGSEGRLVLAEAVPCLRRGAACGQRHQPDAHVPLCAAVGVARLRRPGCGVQCGRCAGELSYTRPSGNQTESTREREALRGSLPTGKRRALTLMRRE